MSTEGPFNMMILYQNETIIVFLVERCTWCLPVIKGFQCTCTANNDIIVNYHESLSACNCVYHYDTEGWLDMGRRVTMSRGRGLHEEGYDRTRGLGTAEGRGQSNSVL